MPSNRFRYHARAQKQKIVFQGKLIGCTDTTFAILVDAATLGGCKVTEAQVRELSNERFPDPNSPGLNLNQIVAVAHKLHIEFTNHTGKDFTYLAKALQSNHRAVVQLWYSEVGGGNIGHAFYVEQISGDKAYCIDPIKGKYIWVSVTDLHRAMKVFAEKAGTASGLYFGLSRQTQWISSNQAPDLT